MALERWDYYIRSRQNQTDEPNFHVTPPEPVQGVPGVTVRYISVRNGGYHNGLEDGFYVQTNIHPESYEESRPLRDAIRSHVVLALMAPPSASIPGFDDAGPRLDLMSGIRVGDKFIAPDGALLFRIEPVMPTELQDAMQGVSLGTTDATFVPADQILPPEPR